MTITRGVCFILLNYQCSVTISNSKILHFRHTNINWLSASVEKCSIHVVNKRERDLLFWSFKRLDRSEVGKTWAYLYDPFGISSLKNVFILTSRSFILANEIILPRARFIIPRHLAKFYAILSTIFILCNIVGLPFPPIRTLQLQSIDGMEHFIVTPNKTNPREIEFALFYNVYNCDIFSLACGKGQVTATTQTIWSRIIPAGFESAEVIASRFETNPATRT